MTCECHYQFKFNDVGYPCCIVENPYSHFGRFLSFELVPNRIMEVRAAINSLQSTNEPEIEVERDDALLTFHTSGQVELDIWDVEESLPGMSIASFTSLFDDWVRFLSDSWEGYQS